MFYLVPLKEVYLSMQLINAYHVFQNLELYKVINILVYLRHKYVAIKHSCMHIFAVWLFLWENFLSIFEVMISSQDIAFIKGSISNPCKVPNLFIDNLGILLYCACQFILSVVVNGEETSLRLNVTYWFEIICRTRQTISHMKNLFQGST